MNMTKTTISIALVTSMVCATSALGNTMEEEMPLNYLQGQLGVFQPQDDLDDAEFDLGFNGAITYGRHLTENAIIEATYNFTSSDRDCDSVPVGGGILRRGLSLYIKSPADTQRRGSRWCTRSLWRRRIWPLWCLALFRNRIKPPWLSGWR